MRSEFIPLMGAGPIEFEAEVGFRRGNNIRFGGKPSIQKLLLNVRNKELGIDVDHIIMTVGKEIPAVPFVYSRIVPDMKIRFLAEARQYIRKSDNSVDYGLKMISLLDSHKVDVKYTDSEFRKSLKDAWMRNEITSKQYLCGLEKGRRC